MDHNDHVNLLRPADLNRGGLWADFGAGSGAFTLALRELKYHQYQTPAPMVTPISSCSSRRSAFKLTKPATTS